MSLAIISAAAIRTTADISRTTLRVTDPRSKAGERIGEIIANGATVSPRYRVTFDLAASGEMEKKRDPARATVVNVSAATEYAWIL